MEKFRNMPLHTLAFSDYYNFGPCGVLSINQPDPYVINKPNNKTKTKPNPNSHNPKPFPAHFTTQAHPTKPNTPRFYYNTKSGSNKSQPLTFSLLPKHTQPLHVTCNPSLPTPNTIITLLLPYSTPAIPLSTIYQQTLLPATG